MSKKSSTPRSVACAESNFSNFKFEYLGENKFLRKTILAFYQGPRKVRFMKKGRKARDTAPLIKGGFLKGFFHPENS